MLVLEVRDSDSHVSINNGGRVQTGLAAIEVHVKDHGAIQRRLGIFRVSKIRHREIDPGDGDLLFLP